MYFKYSIDEEISDLAYQMTLPPAAWLDVQTARRMFAEFTKKVHEILRERRALDESSLKIVEMMATGYDNHLVKVRVYIPIECINTKCAGLVFFHGGGWIVGNLETDHFRLVRYSKEAKVVVVSVDYRLAPENPFPIPPEDCYNVAKWVYQNADMLNIDPNRIGVGGENAGANLAAAISLMARDRREIRISYQLLVYPILNLFSSTESTIRFTDTPILNRNLLQTLIKLYLAENITNAYHPYASPLLAPDFRGLPMTYIAIGQYDPGRDDALEYAKKLLSQDIPVEFHLYSSEPHSFDMLYPLSTVSIRAIEEQVSILKKFIKGYHL